MSGVDWQRQRENKQHNDVIVSSGHRQSLMSAGDTVAMTTCQSSVLKKRFSRPPTTTYHCQSITGLWNGRLSLAAERWEMWARRQKEEMIVLSLTSVWWLWSSRELSSMLCPGNLVLQPTVSVGAEWWEEESFVVMLTSVWWLWSCRELSSTLCPWNLHWSAHWQLVIRPAVHLSSLYHNHSQHSTNYYTGWAENWHNFFVCLNFTNY